jgi:hypothetical protein
MTTNREKNQRMRRSSLMTERTSRIQVLIEQGFIKSPSEIPDDAIPAKMAAQNHQQLRRLPYSADEYKTYYRDKPFICKQCGSSQVWKAEDQQWYYEVVKGPFKNEATLCLPCRKSKSA